MPPTSAPVSLAIMLIVRGSVMFSTKSVLMCSRLIWSISLARSLADGSELGADAFGRKKLYAVGAAEITEGIMAGDDAALGRWHFVDLLPHIGVEGTQLANVLIACCSELSGVDGIRFGQSLNDVGDVDHTVGKVLPGMGIGDGLFTAGLVLDHGPRLDALARDHHRSLVAARRNQAIHPGIKPQPVDEHELGIGELLGIGRQRFECMGIAVRPNQDGHLGPVAGNLFDHVPQNAEARNDVNFSAARAGRTSGSIIRKARAIFRIISLPGAN